jgi:hypothetical protein
MEEQQGQTEVKKEVVALRPEVAWFAEQMELTLRKNDAKGGWVFTDNQYLTNKIQEHAEKIGLTLEGGFPSAVILEYAVHAANYAMMVGDNVAGPYTR